VSWLRPTVFAALVVATVGAFFVTQHLKVSTPLINGYPRPAPAAFNPVSGRICRSRGPGHKLIDYRRVNFSFYLQHRSDNVQLYVVSQTTGDIVATVAANRHMRLGVRNPDGDFSWNGREGDDDGQLAPDGTYYFRIVLQQEGRTFNWSQTPFQIITTSPHPRVTSVQVTGSAPATVAHGAPPAIIAPPARSVTIHYTPGNFRSASIDIYRTDLPGVPRIVKSFGVNGEKGVAVWNGLIDGRPAPAGTYLVGMTVTDQACNPGQFPIVNPPPPGFTPNAGVTVRYLAALPPLSPVGAGSRASVAIQSSAGGYRWTLWRTGRRKPLSRGSARSTSSTSTLNFRVPLVGAGLLELALRAGANRAIVPVIASAVGGHAAAPVLVVLPALSWQGANPVDDDGDGLPDTLAAGERIELRRPIVGGLPSGLAGQAALLAYLDAHHLRYQLTSDLALATGRGPQLRGHSGVILDGAFRWIPTGLGPDLLAYVGNGGRLLSIGQASLLRTAPLAPSSARPVTAGPPRPSTTSDPFGARPGQHIATAGALVTVIADPLQIFSLTGGALTGVHGYQVIAPPASASASTAGVDATTPAVTGFRIGRGTVVEVGLDDFQQSLAHNASFQELLARLWQILSG
jgi:hypothetical protein